MADMSAALPGPGDEGMGIFGDGGCELTDNNIHTVFVVKFP